MELLTKQTTKTDNDHEFWEELDLDMALSESPPLLKQIVYGLAPAEVGIVVAAGGTGKSYLMLQLATAVVTGVDISGFFLRSNFEYKTGKVLFISAEDDVDEIWRRLRRLQFLISKDKPSLISSWVKKAKSDLSIVSTKGKGIVHLIQNIDKSLAKTKFYEALLNKADGCSLVIIDPIRRFHSLDENNSSDSTEIVQILEEFAQKTGAATIITHHVSKQFVTGEAALEQGAGRGSTALTDGVRWQVNMVTMARDQLKKFDIEADDRKHYVQIGLAKSNHAAPIGDQWLQRTADGLLVATALKAVPKEKGKRKNKGGEKGGEKFTGSFEEDE